MSKAMQNDYIQRQSHIDCSTGIWWGHLHSSLVLSTRNSHKRIHLSADLIRLRLRIFLSCFPDIFDPSRLDSIHKLLKRKNLNHCQKCLTRKRQNIFLMLKISALSLSRVTLTAIACSNVKMLASRPRLIRSMKEQDQRFWNGLAKLMIEAMKWSDHADIRPNGHKEIWPNGARSKYKLVTFGFPLCIVIIHWD